MAYLLPSTVHVGKKPKLNALTSSRVGYLKAVVMRDDESVWMKKDEFSCEEDEIDIAEPSENESEGDEEDDINNCCDSSSESETVPSPSISRLLSQSEPVNQFNKPKQLLITRSSSESDGTDKIPQVHLPRADSTDSTSAPSTPSLCRDFISRAPATVPISPVVLSFSEGSRVDVLRSSGTWTSGTVQRVSAYYTIKLDDSSVKLIPLTHSQKYIRTIAGENPIEQSSEYGWGSLVTQIEKVLRPRGSTGMKSLRRSLTPIGRRSETPRRRKPKRSYIDI